jgi:predicted MFS family arabinose efflux permease
MRVFKQAMGMSPLQFVTREQIMRAQQLIRETSRSLTDTDSELPRRPAARSAVLAMSLGAFALVASEFMPVSLLTPIATDLHISEGQVGQAISISGAFAVLTSLFISTLARRLDRKVLLLSLTLLTILSGTVVAFAPNYEAGGTRGRLVIEFA